ncbi:DnaT-like ssDNA-binding protein [Pseudomonas coronafaciens]|uniref:DnaT-like ssDNA-binding protein n=1 Tax=Pseudomonas coronafaciens TaxID=53409 RepID=UPI000EFF6AAD|nr:DnaT-like ssDNA-binding protein [Pseudomonas coronafaciens]RMP22203.1 Prophage PssSM-02, putative head-tail conector protein [Pseudomonas coronafaciens pv. atropurpurea]
MLIIEDGTGVPGAESYATAAELVIYAGKFGVAIPAEEAAQEAVLRRAALVMDGMTWKGRKSTGDQALSWPRREIRLDGENKPERYLPARIQYGQMALAAEIHADDIDPIDKRKGAVTKEKVDGAVEREYATISNASKRLLPAAPDRPSATQFADYLQRRGLFAVRA